MSGCTGAMWVAIVGIAIASVFPSHHWQIVACSLAAQLGMVAGALIQMREQDREAARFRRALRSACRCIELELEVTDHQLADWRDL